MSFTHASHAMYNCHSDCMNVRHVQSEMLGTDCLIDGLAQMCAGRKPPEFSTTVSQLQAATLSCSISTQARHASLQ